jgi:uncharacterized metal-binding protein
MDNSTLKEIFNNIMLIKWVIGSIISLVALSLAVMFWAVRSAMSKVKDNDKKVQDMEKCIVGIKHDISGIIRVCEEKHRER